jgi:cytochrome c
MTMHRVGWPSAAAILIALLAAATALGLARGTHPFSSNDDDEAARLVTAYGCGTCHVMHGIDGADGIVGPQLTGFDTRRMIAGRLANTPANLALWISQPQAIDPGNAMPDTGISRSQAAVIARFLYAHP